MTLLLNNVLPSDHNSDLPLPKCQLVYVILTRMSVHVAQVIADAIYLFAGMAPTRHPLDLEKSNRALGIQQAPPLPGHRANLQAMRPQPQTASG